MNTFIKTLFVSAVVLLSGGAYSQSPQQVLTAKMQLIHNSPDAALKAVDVYINGHLMMDDMNFRTASKFITIGTSVPMRIDIAPSTSVSSQQSIYSITTTLTPLQNYIVVLNGMDARTGYSPIRPLKLTVYNKGRIVPMDSSNIDMLFYHGSTDAPIVKIEEISAPLGMITGNISYDRFIPEYLELPNIDYKIKVNIIPAVEGAAGVPEDLGSYYLPFRTMGLNMEAVTLVSSGFVHPELNSNGASFGMFLVLPSGSDLVPLERIVLGVSDFAAADIKLYPNPASSMLNLEIPFNYNLASAKIIDFSGREVMSMDALSSQINISRLTNGVYVLNLNIDDKNYVRKFVVNR